MDLQEQVNVAKKAIQEAVIKLSGQLDSVVQASSEAAARRLAAEKDLKQLEDVVSNRRAAVASLEAEEKRLSVSVEQLRNVLRNVKV